LLLVAFGIDSAIELASAFVVFRRFRIESHGGFPSKSDARAMERKTARIAGCLLFLLSAYVLVQAGFGLVTRHAAETSPVGIAVAIIAALGMPVLAKAKLRLADKIDSRALRADAMETLTCGYLAWVLLAGLALNAVTRWWWIDSVASLAIAQTFDGAHPCSLCHVVSKGKNSEKKQDLRSATPKIDMICAPLANRIERAFVPFEYAIRDCFLFELGHSPPVPPPRSLLS
jgi:F0F1-type ATP synthase assembly protein I